MIGLVLYVILAVTVCTQQTVAQRTLTQQERDRRLLLAQQRLLQPLTLARQLQELARQEELLRQEDALLLNDRLTLQPSVRAEAASLEQQLRTLQRQQQALQARQEARRRAEQRRQQERTRLRLLRLQQEAIRRGQGQFLGLPINASNLLLTQAEIAQNQALLQQALRTGQQGPYIPIIEDERDGPFQDGTYYFKYTTGNGIVREEGARLTSPYTHEVTGSYSYTAPNGELIIMEYIADENGYRAFPVRPDRPSTVPRPERIPVPPPYRPPLPEFQGLAPPLDLTLTRTKRRNDPPSLSMFTSVQSDSEEVPKSSESTFQPPAVDAGAQTY